ncbi:MAG TPA: DUF6249 domain-containing protein [Ktedonobacterales bacterium]|nr:DUF6249 domain-containing protein [Ktedonobacterales bacterium]
MNSLVAVGLEWLGTLALFLAGIVFVRYLEHRERMTMIEHGILPEAFGGPGHHARAHRGSGMLRGGLITAMVGVAVTIGLYNLGYLLPAPFNAVPGQLGPWLLPGLIPTAVGTALVASYYLAPPRADQPSTSDEKESSAGENESSSTKRTGTLHVVDGPRDTAVGSGED